MGASPEVEISHNYLLFLTENTLTSGPGTGLNPLNSISELVDILGRDPDIFMVAKDRGHIIFDHDENSIFGLETFYDAAHFADNRPYVL